MADNQTKKYLDILTAFPSGINSGVAPILLPKDQASFAINTTFRGGYATDRAPVQKLALNFGGDAELETAFRNGFFQGASPVPYRPDFGPSQHIVQISGRLFAVTESGSVWDVKDITITGDPNDATTSQVWMWQAEKWMIISDGSARLPIFYDGVTSRRSYGPSITLATTLAIGNFPTPRVIGEIVQVQLTADYTGPFNVPVRFNGAIYEPTSSSTADTYSAFLTNVSGTIGSTVFAGSQITINPDIIGQISAISEGHFFGNFTGYNDQYRITFPTNHGLSVGDGISVDGATGQSPHTATVGIVIDSKTIGTTHPGYGGFIQTDFYVGNTVTRLSSIGPVVIVGNTTVDFVIPPNAPQPSTTTTAQVTSDPETMDGVYFHRTFTSVPVSSITGLYIGAQVSISGISGPSVTWEISGISSTAISIRSQQLFFGTSNTQSVIPNGSTIQIASVVVGGTIQIFINNQYSGPPNQAVWIGGEQFLITAEPQIVTTTLYLRNLTDTSDAGAAIPASDITSVPEIPACRMGAYGLGQNWFSFTDGLGFGPSDLVGSSSGTQAYNYRDAVLKTSDLEIMGGFRIPNAGEIITSITFVATLDAALGQGPLQIGVSSGMFSVKAPFTLLDFQGLTNAVSGDLVTAPITNPILTKSLLGFGPIAQNSTVVANSDTIFRSFEGVNSLILARRNFSDIGGNTPISREMTRAIDLDNKSLLSYSSAIVFDNRLRMTCSPQVSGQGVFHMGELVLNYDLISSLRGKAPPVWEGLWTGTNVLQYSQGLFGTVSRAFAFTFNITDEQIELYELLPTGTVHFDNGTTRIRWIVETPVLFNAQVKNLTDVARMMDGEMYLSDINGQVDVVVLYRPVFYPCWRPWHTFSVCSDMSADNAKEQTIHPLGFGEPDPRDCDPINNQSFRQGVGFQLRLEFTGHCKLWGVRVLGHQVPTDAFAKPAGC